MASSQIARCSADLRQAGDMPSTQGNDFEKISKLKISLKFLEDYTVSYEVSKENLNSEISMAATESTRPLQL